MKKLFYAGLFCAVAGAGVFALVTPIEAKGGHGGHGGFRSGAHWHSGSFHHGRRFAHRHHRHHPNFAGGWWGWGYPYGNAYLGDPDYADAPPPPPRIAEPVVRTVENSKDVCSTEPVTVRATGGGETTVNVIRC